MKTFNAVSLFAGIGGIDLALNNKSIDVIWANEFDKYASQTYKANHDTYLDTRDIREIAEAEIPNHDILVAGFPCQPFSHAGRQNGFNDTRGTLFFEICRIAEKKKPEIILLENVKGLVSHNKGNTLKTILNSLSSIGYSCEYFVLNSKDYGLPQSRNRLFILGFKDIENILYFFAPTTKSREKPLKSILEKTVNEKYTLTDRAWNGYQNHAKNQSDKGNTFGYKIVDISTYSPALLANYGKFSGSILIPQNQNNPRRLTPRECARLQGFPDTFKIPVSDYQAYKQFGNSVSIPVICSITEEIVRTLHVKKDFAWRNTA